MLSGEEIKKRIEKGEICISPFNSKQVNTNSYDVRTGSKFFFIPENTSKLYIPGNKKSVASHWQEGQASKWVDLVPGLVAKNIISEEDVMIYEEVFNKDDDIILLAPGQMILAHTVEDIGTDPKSKLVPIMSSKSSTVRNMLSVCRCGGQGSVGYKSKWTMEIKNESDSLYIPIVVGECLAQITFMEVVGEVIPYDGKYNGEWTADSMLPK